MFHPAIESEHLYNYACCVEPCDSATLRENQKFFCYFCWFPRWPCNLTSLEKCSTKGRDARASVQNIRCNPVTPAATTSVHCGVIFIRKNKCLYSLGGGGGCLGTDIHVLTPWVSHTLALCVGLHFGCDPGFASLFLFPNILCMQQQVRV